MKNRTCYLYWIHLPWHTNIKKDGYIGVSIDPEMRFRKHLNASNNKSEYIVHRAMRKYTDAIIFDVLCIGNEDYIYDLEYKLRPIENIGWNIASGGNRNNLSDKSIAKMAESKVSLKRIDVLNLWVDYFEKGLTLSDISEKYNICQWSSWCFVNGKSKAYPDLEQTRIILEGNRIRRPPINGSVSEEQYNEILYLRESGETFEEIARIFGLSPMTIFGYCKGDRAFLKKFKSFRVIK